MKHFKKLLYIEFKRNYRLIIYMILLILLFAVLLNSIMYLFENKKIKLNTSIGIVNEDESVKTDQLMKSIIGNDLKDIITFRKTDLESGKKLLDKSKILALIHLEKDSFEKLNTGKNVSIDIYINKKDDFRVQFLIRYIENMVEVLNNAQNSAMIYYDVLQDGNVNYNQRIEKLNDLSLKYIKKFIFRKSVFSKNELANKFLGFSIFKYYYNLLIVLFIIISSIIINIKIQNDLKNKLIFRLLNCNYKLKEIIISKLIIGSIYISFFILPLKGVILFLSSELTILNFSIFFIKYLLFISIIQLIVIYIYLKISKEVIRDIVFVIVFGSLFFIGGLAFPKYSMIKILLFLREINIVYIGFKLISFLNINFKNIIAIIIYIFSFSFLIKREVLKYD
ncbi:MAG: ABC transporter permease [Bacillota bacterium]